MARRLRPTERRAATAATATTAAATTTTGPAWSARDDWVAAVALVMVAAVPLAMLPGGYSRFVLPKLLLAAATVAAAAVTRPAGRLSRRTWVLLGTGGVWLVIAAATSAAPLAQLVGRWPRYEGLVALPLYAGALWAGARLLGPGEHRRGRVRLLGRALTVVAAATALVATLEALGLRPLGGAAERPGSFLGNASHLGSFGVLLLGLALPWLVRRRDRWSVTAVSAAVLMVGTSGSRAALGGAAVVGAVVLVLAALGRSRVAQAGWSVLSALAVVTGVALALPGVRDRLAGVDELAGATVSGRWLLWADTWQLVATSPVTGVGPSGFVDAIAGRHSEAWWREVGPANPPDSAHTVVGQLLAAGGVPLLLLATALAALVAGDVVRRLHDAPGGDSTWSGPADGAVAGLLGYVVTLGVGFTTAGVTVPAALVLGALLAVPVRSALPSRRERAARTGWLVVGVVWTLALVPACAAEIELARGTSAAASGRSVEAEASFAAAARLRPWDQDVALLAATAFAGGTAAGDPAQAQAALDWSTQGLAAVPDSVELAVTRARALGVLGAPADGLALLDPHLARSPLNTDLLTAAALLHVQAQDLPAALDRLLAVTAVDPGDADAWADVATLAGALGDEALAAEADATARRLDAEASAD